MANLFAEKLELCVSEQMENGLDKVNAKEMGEVVDMIKDSYEIEKLKAEKKYYESVVDAMHDKGNEEWYDDMGYPVRRDSRGRYTSSRSMGGSGRSMSMRRGFEYQDDYPSRPVDMTRDMYSDRSSRYGYSHDEYMEKRKDYNMTNPESAKKRKQLLNDYMDDLYDMAKDMVQDMSPEEKQMWKDKLTQIANM